MKAKPKPRKSKWLKVDYNYGGFWHYFSRQEIEAFRQMVEVL